MRSPVTSQKVLFICCTAIPFMNAIPKLTFSAEIGVTAAISGCGLPWIEWRKI